MLRGRRSGTRWGGNRRRGWRGRGTASAWHVGRSGVGLLPAFECVAAAPVRRISENRLFDASDSFSIFNSPTHHKPYLSPCPPRRPPRRDRPTRVSPYPPSRDAFVFRARRLSARPLHSLALKTPSFLARFVVETLPFPAPARVFVPRRTPPLASPPHARCIRNPLVLPPAPIRAPIAQAAMAREGWTFFSLRC